MPKQRSKVVVDEAYFNLLETQARVLGNVFNDVGRASVTIDTFKWVKRIDAEIRKLPEGATRAIPLVVGQYLRDVLAVRKRG